MEGADCGSEQRQPAGCPRSHDGDWARRSDDDFGFRPPVCGRRWWRRRRRGSEEEEKPGSEAAGKTATEEGRKEGGSGERGERSRLERRSLRRGVSLRLTGQCSGERDCGGEARGRPGG